MIHRSFLVLQLRFFAFFITALLVLTACIPVGRQPVESLPTTRVSPAVEVFFTDPDSPGADSYRGGPDSEFVRAIDSAILSVDVAVMNLTLWSVRDALIAAHQRGVTVRVVTDSDNLDGDEFVDLAAAGVPLLGDRREGLMHHKFTVIDRQEVWTGSMNYTISDGYRSHNNLIRLRSVELAESYRREFEEMYTDDRFGDFSRRDTPYSELEIDGQPVEVMFSPDDGVAKHLVDIISGAQESIDILAYSWTLDSLTEALLSRSAAGVRVRGVFDAGQQGNIGADYQELRQAGLDIRLDRGEGNLHHKVLIIDDKLVVTGSYNFSSSAELRNDENILFLSSTGIARAFETEFDRLFTASVP